ncbi:hypothetical protein DQ04_19151000 [Trypanosoma grayi]|uniref:hypothetical protein n=1 Tax=Trypanosoma grayi TaxID=71804 RepID=UPI0004F451F2|nr:hypothetical protein DQ04_19151000 [Trypanosoma grayi]KEG05707.1 hypothetical protein DQ04_19151000 [Trypanosoma grayi]
MEKSLEDLKDSSTKNEEKPQNSGVLPPAGHATDNDSSTDDHRDASETRNPRNEDNQNGAVQSQKPSAPTSPSSLQSASDKQENNPVAEKDKDTKNADSSVSSVWVHAPLLLLTLFAVAAV